MLCRNSVRQKYCSRSLRNAFTSPYKHQTQDLIKASCAGGRRDLGFYTSCFMRTQLHTHCVSILQRQQTSDHNTHTPDTHNTHTHTHTHTCISCRNSNLWDEDERSDLIKHLFKRSQMPWGRSFHVNTAQAVSDEYKLRENRRCHHSADICTVLQHKHQIL